MKVKTKLLSVLLAAALILAILPSAGAEDYTFTDRNGNTVTVPENAWATRVVSFTHGSPWTSIADSMDPETTLGAPDLVELGDNYTTGGVTLGGGGVLVLEFSVDICDGEGDDIYVFEVGPAVEATRVEVSSDLSIWYDAGVASGSTAGVDLNGKVPAGSRFRYVRLTDLKDSLTGRWPGADIDAVAGLNVKPISSGWAQSEVDRAQELGLIPDILNNAVMTEPINRLEFAAVSVKVFEKLAATQALPASVNPFTDCSDLEMLKAYNLGITDGTSATTFSPNNLLNREQAATMLTRVFKRATIPGWTLTADGDFTLNYTRPAAFADDQKISGWAKDSVYFMAANQIINGVGNNNFAPSNTTSAEEANHYANATREQALAIAVRMVENLK